MLKLSTEEKEQLEDQIEEFKDLFRLVSEKALLTTGMVRQDYLQRRKELNESITNLEMTLYGCRDFRESR